MVAPHPIDWPDRRFTEDEWQLISYGFRAQQMEDKWNAWCDGDTLHLGRSWTGYEIYRVEFGQDDTGRFITAAYAESAPDRYNATAEYSATMLPVLLDMVLLAHRRSETFTLENQAQRAEASLTGLRVGDALGSQFFLPSNRDRLRERSTPAGPWRWTDDTQMATVLVDHLTRRYGLLREDNLAAEFAEAFDLYRGYGPGAVQLLRGIARGGDWRELASAMFGGTGSMGNGAAMRIAPLGAWHADHTPAVVATVAARSAEVTHRHPEGIAAAVAVAVAAALASSDDPPDSADLLTQVIAHTPDGLVKDGLISANGFGFDTDPAEVAETVGNGSQVLGPDTVPLCVWLAARHLGDYRAGFWATASVGGDVDTNCAIVGGILGAYGGPDSVPPQWRDATEPARPRPTDT
ncbi:ADP-ribosylglycohydrolase [Stackebrandtia endophytica]|uniref:ADP-ribosylglycohydrolase n=1 Tax=Stackebrandtia endophytica TaxID=1496996 RepID=A0A543APR0_9ACTN|nr:ADP-ribosylglycohydrolase family protein [Stackebrandtia endophytica]TQL74564.1 ADP-ribosylglycohydrolase [Stackebrandtia endophytica]